MNIILAYFENMVNIPDGLEKVICDFANEFTRRGHRITIVDFDSKQGRPAHPLLESVPVINLQTEPWLRKTRQEKIVRECYRLFGRAAVRSWIAGYKRKHGVSRFSAVVKEIQPDVIVSFETMTSAEICREQIDVPLVSSLQNEPHICCRNLPMAEKEALEKSQAVHVLMNSYVCALQELIANPHIVYIPNAIPQCTSPADLNQKKDTYRIINVARLNKKQKRQEILIEAFSKIAAHYPKWNVELWGGDTSGYKNELKHMIKRLHMEDRIFIKGVTHQVDQVYASADIFAFPSKFEGFPLSLSEAMGAGLPPVGFKSCSSVNELIIDGENGLLAEDGVEAFAQALEMLMKNQEARVRMGKAAHDSMKAYSPENVWNQWESLLREVVKNAKKNE